MHRYLLTFITVLFFTAQAHAAAVIGPAFSHWSSTSGGVVDAAKQGTNTMIVQGATFSKPGGKPTLTIGPWVDATATNLASAVASAISIGRALHITQQIDITVDTDLSAVPEIDIIQGGSFNISVGKTLILPSNFHAGDAQVFSGSGTVTGLKSASPQWFGAQPGNDATNAVVKAALSSQNVVFSQSYIVNGASISNRNVSFTFMSGAKLYSTATVNYTILLTDCNSVFDSPEIDGSSKARIGIYSLRGTISVHKAKIYGMSSTTDIVAGIEADSCTKVTIRDSEIYNISAPINDSIVGNAIGAARAIYVLSSVSTLIDGNYLHDISGEEGDTIQAWTGDGVTITNNFITGFSRRAIKTSATNTQIENNVIRENSVNSSAAIPYAVVNFLPLSSGFARGNDVYAMYSPTGILSEVSDTAIVNNTIHTGVNNTGDWVYAATQRAILTMEANTQVLGNKIFGGYYGIEVQKGGNIVKSNIVVDSKQAGLRLGTTSLDSNSNIVSNNVFKTTVTGYIPSEAISIVRQSKSVISGNELISYNSETNYVVGFDSSSTGNYCRDNVGNSEFQYHNLGTSTGNFVDGALTVSYVYDMPSIANGASASFDVTVPGAKTSDYATATWQSTASVMVVSARVTTTDTVKVTVLNLNGAALDLPSATWTVKVYPH